MPVGNDLERRLFALETNVVGLVKVNRALVARMSALVLEWREPGSLKSADVDEMLESLDELHALLARVSEFLPDVGD
jgi:hypothetical protein